MIRITLFLLLTLSSPYSLVVAGEYLESYALSYKKYQSALDNCEIDYTDRVSCDFDSIFSRANLGHKRTWCDPGDMRSKPKDKKLWKQCLTRADNLFPIESTVNLSKTERSQKQKCAGLVGGYLYFTKPDKYANRRLLRNWDIYTVCLTTDSFPEFVEAYQSVKQEFESKVVNFCHDYYQKYQSRNAASIPHTCGQCFNQIYGSSFRNNLKIREIHSNVLTELPNKLDRCWADFSYINTQKKFGSYSCKGDCSGHEAGYEWAKENAFLNEDECHEIENNNSISFVEGCLVYVEE